MTEDQLPIVSADLSCLKCNTETTKVYDPVITYDQFIDDKPKLICPDCNSTYSSLPHFSVDVWRTTLLEKYSNLAKVANDNLSGLWDSLEFELSVQKILNISDCTLPFAGIVLGRPSSLKTVGIDLFRKWPNTYYTDSFSAKSMVSHSTAVKRDELEKIDMLPR